MGPLGPGTLPLQPTPPVTHSTMMLLRCVIFLILVSSCLPEESSVEQVDGEMTGNDLVFEKELKDKDGEVVEVLDYAYETTENYDAEDADVDEDGDVEYDDGLVDGASFEV